MTRPIERARGCCTSASWHYLPKFGHPHPRVRVPCAGPVDRFPERRESWPGILEAAAHGLGQAADFCLVEQAVAFFNTLCPAVGIADLLQALERSEEHTSELQSLMPISYAVF